MKNGRTSAPTLTRGYRVQLKQALSVALFHVPIAQEVHVFPVMGENNGVLIPKLSKPLSAGYDCVCATALVAQT
jgi:hypothetical protein